MVNSLVFFYSDMFFNPIFLLAVLDLKAKYVLCYIPPYFQSTCVDFHCNQKNTKFNCNVPILMFVFINKGYFIITVFILYTVKI